ncbi:penicillin-binding protein-related factor A recombinase [Mycoplasmopsis maculosa]|uniref:Holliday junction resolvase RecU n=1 Tax=Mycoplasmopsis maculosa TaxID=114885 RepID=A0A449B3E2_9BACT|nr:Holliday junction resolvase RecU [Mycoplasmopsis maculosa]VEU75107.1 penicillin-binding protein-related factor A recombinase [Mycoplasmopsis maculosa]
MNKNRGMFLEKIINNTINHYWENKIAFIEKKDLPIKFRSINNEENKIKLKEAFIYKKSTVDYIGCYKGVFIAFEAKTTNEKFLPKSNIYDHQIEYLKNIDKNYGIAFLIIFFNLFNEFYLIKINDLLELENNNSYYKYEDIKNKGTEIKLTFPGIIDFVPYIL